MSILRLPILLAGMAVQGVLLALGQVWANKIRSILTTIGIVIGVASVTAVIAALTGMKQNILDDFATFGVNRMYILPDRPREGPHAKAPWKAILFEPEQFDGLLEHCPSVSAFCRLSRMGATAQFEDQSAEVNLIGIEPSWHEIEDRDVIEGRKFGLVDDAEARGVCLITRRVQEKLRMDAQCVGQRMRIANRAFTVVGVVAPPSETNMLGGDQQIEEVFIPFRTARKINRWGLYVMANSRSPEVSEEAQAEVRFLLRKARHLKPGEPDTFRVEAIQKYLEKFKQIAIMLTLVAGGIVSISLLVGGVGIMNIMLVSVSERTREIGLRKAVGARPSAILMQFLIEAVVLCLIGGLIGLLGGQGFAWLMSLFPQAKLTKAHIPGWAVGLSFGFSAAVGVTFGFFPALKAALLDPIEALRHE